MNRKTTISAAGPALTTERIISQLAIGQLAMDHHHALAGADSAKRAYHDAVRAYEAGEGRIRSNDPEFEQVKIETATEFAAYQVAKRAAYNIKRRLHNACRKAAL